ncbi:hypothetical protein MTR67_026573 [Solanum verrucosum]|uniref:Uncharacterized protein n=1 Tax=Solanum verrucosum TaxID=315347 RepID=A0AAF0TZT7_SOLVR|nr:hypothetical protein MTR67_026573 [Solanum verrucosum]
MDKMMTQLDLLSKHLIGGRLKSVNAVEPTVGNAQIMPSLTHYKMKKFNTWEIKWGVLTQIINDKVGTKVGTRIDMVVGKTGGMEIREIDIWKNISTCLPMIVHTLKNQLGQKQAEQKTYLQASTTRFKGPIKFLKT